MRLNEPMPGGRTEESPAALVVGDRRIGQAELRERSARLARGLRDIGAGPGDRIAVMLPNGAEFFETAGATALLGANLIPVNWHLRATEIAWVLADSGAVAVVAHAAFDAEVEAALSEVAACRRIRVGGPAPGALGYEELLAPAPPGVGEAAAGGAPSFMFYTSGTTGRPKGAVQEAGSMDRQIGVLLETFGLGAGDRHLLAGPAYHAAPGGWAAIYLAVGATVVVLPRFDAREVLRLVAEERITTTFLVPSHFIRLLEIPEEERARYDLSSLRLVLHAGEPCPARVKRAMLDILPGAAVTEYYGCSEAGLATAITRQEWVEHPGSVGRALRGVDLAVLGPDDERLPPGSEGLVCYTPWSRVQYHGDHEKTARAWHGDLFSPGDLGYLDERGWLYLSDRRDDLILRGGVNVYPREVELALLDHPAVADCAVFGVPDDRLGQVARAVVEPRAELTAETLASFCREHLAAFKCPESFVLVDRMPRDPNGKVRRRELRETYGPGVREKEDT